MNANAYCFDVCFQKKIQFRYSCVNVLPSVLGNLNKYAKYFCFGKLTTTPLEPDRIFSNDSSIEIFNEFEESE